MGQSLFKKYSEFQNFDELFYCGMTRLTDTNSDVFIQCQYTRTTLTLFPLQEGKTTPTPHSNFLKNFRKYEPVWALFL